MTGFPWWTEAHIAFEQRVNAFVEEVMPLDAETRWKRKFPWEIFQRISQEGFTGAGIPKAYGGLGLGATGACIAAEAISRMPGPGRVFVGNMLGGLHQVVELGSEEQKKYFLSQITRGEIGAIVITEPFAGTDAAAIEMTAKADGTGYILNGKKRFIVSAGVATRYMVYARTSDSPEDRQKFRHLTAFIVEKDSPGFSVEMINEVIGFENIQNGVLNFRNVHVPATHVIGKEGDGWQVMTGGLNFERTLISAQTLGWMRELMGNVVPYTRRRVQFGKPTNSFVNNQFKIADLITTWKMARLLTYYTAYAWDLGWDTSLESNIAKLFNCEGVMKASLDAIQLMGGDGLTLFYPLAAIMKVAKVETIAGGTMDACRLIIHRIGTKQLARQLKMPRRVIHKQLGVPVISHQAPTKQTRVDEDSLLKVLAEDYRVNPGLYMNREDLKSLFDVDEAALDRVLLSLEKQGLVKLNRDKRGIALAKATYDGLDKAFPAEYYRWFPDWIKEKNIF